MMNMMKRKGFVLVYILSLGVLIIFIATAFFMISNNALALSATTANSIKAYYIAEAGIAKKFMDLRSGNASTLSESFSLASGDTGTYSVTVTNTGGGTLRVYRLDSTGTYKGATRRISLTFRQISCSRFAYFSNDEDQMLWYGERPIWFVSGDTLRGPFHTNDQINISGDPLFEGAVTSTWPDINYAHGGPPEDDPEFKESLSLGVPGIQLPLSTEIVSGTMTAAQQVDGLYLSGDSAIMLLPNGTMNVTNEAKGWRDQNVPLPANGAVYVNNGYLDISGTLKGQLTVATNRSIYVVGNLLYSSNPRTDPLSGDLLGLVAQNNVYIGRDAPYNVEVDAYIVALNTSFGVENYSGALKGTLTLYGGITQYRRGPVGTFNSTTGAKVSGYTKDYYYDGRLLNATPLYFPPAKDAEGRIAYIKMLYSES